MPKDKNSLLFKNPAALLNGLLAGDRKFLSKAITLVESNLPTDQELAMELLEMVYPHTGKAMRIGITGIPGVGKSTFIETFGMHLSGLGKKVAVLAVDPSSQRSGGSILGDKTRMQHLAQQENAFIRPSASGLNLGGVAKKTRETLLLCEAAGFEVVLVETVGAGQSEAVVHGMTDFFLLLLLTNAGDELQGIKRGIMELADAFGVHKADGANAQKARLFKSELEMVIPFLGNDNHYLIPKVFCLSSLENIGIESLWQHTESWFVEARKSGSLQARRASQNQQWVKEMVWQKVLSRFETNPELKHALQNFQGVDNQSIFPGQIAKKIWDGLWK